MGKLSEDVATVSLTEMELRNPMLKLESPASFEEAITKTGYGKFNFLLAIIIIPAVFSSLFEITMMSFVFPVAQCDLNLSLNDKGVLNAITYIGMISSGFAWGFLADTLGRRKILMVGFLVDAFFVLLGSISQNFTMLVIAKFMGGCIVNGPKSALTSYVSEFHCAKYRARQQMILGFIHSIGSIILPLLAIAIFPLQIDLQLFNGFIKLHSWNFFIIACSLPSLLSGILFYFLPETPKFLMTAGKNKEALDVFKMVYSWNSGKSPDNYPVSRLIDENCNKKNLYNSGGVKKNRPWQQFKPLFFKPHLSNLVMVCFLQMMFMLSVHTLRLWLPQIFQAIHDYKHQNNGTISDLCAVLQQMKPKNETQCSISTDISVYTNVIIVALTCMVGYTAGGFFINKLGKNKLLCILGLIAGICGSSMYFAKDSVAVVILSSIFIATASIGSKVIVTVIVDLFPTTVRTMTVSTCMIFGRIGAMSGNLLFPVFVSLGCAPPFFTIGVALMLSGCVSLMLPNTDMKALM